MCARQRRPQNRSVAVSMRSATKGKSRHQPDAKPKSVGGNGSRCRFAKIMTTEAGPFLHEISSAIDDWTRARLLYRLTAQGRSQQEGHVGLHCAKAQKSIRRYRCEGIATLETRGALNYGLVMGWKGEFENRAVRFSSLDPQSPTMGVDHRTAN